MNVCPNCGDEIEVHSDDEINWCQHVVYMNEDGRFDNLNLNDNEAPFVQLGLI